MLQALGVEHFLPMADLSVKPVDERLRNLGGTAKLLIDCVKMHNPEVKVFEESNAYGHLLFLFVTRG